MFFSIVRQASYVTLFLMRHFSAPIFELQRASLSFFFLSQTHPPTSVVLLQTNLVFSSYGRLLFHMHYMYVLCVYLRIFYWALQKLNFLGPSYSWVFFKVKSVNLISNSELNNRQVLHGNCVIGSFDFHSCCFPIFKQRPDSHPV